jgi:hypothetical protein
MTTAAQISNDSRLGKKEIQLLSAISFKAFDIASDISGKVATDKIELLQHFSSFVVKLLKTGFVETDEDRLALIKLAAKLQRQAEALEIMTGKVKVDDLRAAAESFGEKTVIAVG